MKGIQFVVDENGEKVAVQLDLKKYKQLWEDFYDVITARVRADEPRESLQSVKEKLRLQSKLGG